MDRGRPARAGRRPIAHLACLRRRGARGFSRAFPSGGVSPPTSVDGTRSRALDGSSGTPRNRPGARTLTGVYHILIRNSRDADGPQLGKHEDFSALALRCGRGPTSAWAPCGCYGAGVGPLRLLALAGGECREVRVGPLRLLWRWRGTLAVSEPSCGAAIS